MRRALQLAVFATTCFAQQLRPPTQPLTPPKFQDCITVTTQPDAASTPDNALIDIVVKNGCTVALDITVGMKYMANGMRIMEDLTGTEFLNMQPGETAQSIAVQSVAGATACLRNIKAVEAK